MPGVLKTAPLRAAPGPALAPGSALGGPPGARWAAERADEGGSGGTPPLVSGRPPSAPDCPARGRWANGKLSANAVGYVPVVR